MKRTAFYLLSLFLWGTIGLSALHACECTPLPPTEARDSADIILTGTCVQVESNWISGGMKFAFEVDQYWKRRVDKLFIVGTPFQRDCGMPFEEGKSYLIYVRKKFSPKTDICLGTKLLAEADADLALLGPGEAPSASNLIKPMYWTIGGLCFAAMGILAFAVLRKRKE